MDAVAKGTIEAHSGVYCPIKSGDKIVILGKHGDWYHCRNKYGMTGKIPTSYAKPLNSVSINKSSAERPSFTSSTSPKTKKDRFFIKYEHKTESDSEEVFDEIEGNLQRQQSLTMMGGDILQFKNPNIANINDEENVKSKLTAKQPISSKKNIQIDEVSSDSEQDLEIQPGATLMGDIDPNKTEKLKFRYEEKSDEEEEPEIKKGVTLMGTTQNNKLSFIKQ